MKELNYLPSIVFVLPSPLRLLSVRILLCLAFELEMFFFSLVCDNKENTQTRADTQKTEISNKMLIVEFLIQHVCTAI